MAYSGLWRRVALVTIDVTGECIACIFKVDRISELGRTLAANINWITLLPELVLIEVAPCSILLRSSQLRSCRGLSFLRHPTGPIPTPVAASDILQSYPIILPYQPLSVYPNFYISCTLGSFLITQFWKLLWRMFLAHHQERLSSY
jgi:hypothetical protein